MGQDSHADGGPEGGRGEEVSPESHADADAEGGGVISGRVRVVRQPDLRGRTDAACAPEAPAQPVGTSMVGRAVAAVVRTSRSAGLLGGSRWAR
ncbi:hypothetical protein GCM10009823_16920 [Brevibacterium salitolerans]|uniref:Uncharacterized protein n=1 Tax=Brevibacterium salitolerans TaxID=1403566 RepID=A0ABP5IDW1_9MICO